MAETDFGEVLNTVSGQGCPDCGRRGDMLVHPEHRVYPTCGHSRPLPPIGVTSCYGKGTRPAAKSNGAAK